jgi:two-component system cell cycle response regulator
MSSRPLKMLICSENRSLLRGLSRFLGAFGYEVHQAAQPELAARALEWGEPDVLIVDGEPSMPSALELCRSAHDRGRRHAHVFLLLETPDPEDLIDALEAGVDDFLAKPIVYGELLVRLRAGVRALEFERRVREQDRVEPLSGLLSRSAFYEELGRALSATSSQERSGSCLAVGLDFFEQLKDVHGRAAGEAIIRAVAAKLSSLCGESDILACLGGGRFAVWLPGMPEDAATEWAERARAAIEEANVELAETTLPCTASFGTAEWAEGVTGAEAIVRRALEALDCAKTSGHQCMVRFGEFNGEADTWEELAAPGKLFEQTLARDVMTPWPLVLHSDQTADQTAAIFRQTGFRALPVVDADENFVGLVSHDSLRVERSANGRLTGPVTDVMATDAATCDEDSDFSELIQHLEHAPGSLVVILRNGSPTGFLTLKTLAAMSKPVDVTSFRTDVPYSRTSDYLLVHDPCSMDLA